MKRCHQCHTPWVSEKKQPGPKDFCEACSAYLHACLNCRFYDPAKHNQCAIPTTDWVGDKAWANFCDEFEFADADEKAANPASDPARSALDALFGESGATPKTRDDLDRLFGGNE